MGFELGSSPSIRQSGRCVVGGPRHLNVGFARPRESETPIRGCKQALKTGFDPARHTSSWSKSVRPSTARLIFCKSGVMKNPASLLSRSAEALVTAVDVPRSAKHRSKRDTAATAQSNPPQRSGWARRQAARRPSGDPGRFAEVSGDAGLPAFRRTGFAQNLLATRASEIAAGTRWPSASSCCSCCREHSLSTEM